MDKKTLDMILVERFQRLYALAKEYYPEINHFSIYEIDGFVSLRAYADEEGCIKVLDACLFDDGTIRVEGESIETEASA